MCYVTLMIVGVGLFLFLLPPVPGVPIYMVAGIILIASGTNNSPNAEGGMGVAWSIAFAMGTSLLMKLSACTVQQCCIGMPLKKSIKIKQAVGINSVEMRTMKLVLARPGLSIAKCAILIGMPDWPTSVLCGILDLPLIPIIVGTVPVILLIAPTVLSGSFLYLASLPAGDYSWCNSVAAMTLMLAAGVQSGSMVVALFYIQKELENVQLVCGLDAHLVYTCIPNQPFISNGPFNPLLLRLVRCCPP